MQRYRIHKPLVAIRLLASLETEKPGVMTSLPEEAMVEKICRSDLAPGMIEILWAQERYAVFERDLIDRATLIQSATAAS